MPDRRVHAPSERSLKALNGMLWGPSRVSAYTSFLEQWGSKVYLATAVREAQRFGQLRTGKDVTEYTRAIALDARHRVTEIAGRDAASIVRTHDTMLQNKAEALAEAHPDWPWSAVRAKLIAYDDELTRWKAQQVNQTERYAFFQAAFEDFYRNNSELAALFDFTGSLSCDLCQSIAAAGPYTLSGMIDVADPPHIGCGCSFSPAG